MDVESQWLGRVWSDAVGECGVPVPLLPVRTEGMAAGRVVAVAILRSGLGCGGVPGRALCRGRDRWSDIRGRRIQPGAAGCEPQVDHAHSYQARQSRTDPRPDF